MAHSTRRENALEDAEDQDWPERAGPSRASSRGRRHNGPVRKRERKLAGGERKGVPVEGSDRPPSPALNTERETDRF
jgi:hypothetical protein